MSGLVSVIVSSVYTGVEHIICQKPRPAVVHLTQLDQSPSVRLNFETDLDANKVFYRGSLDLY